MREALTTAIQTSTNIRNGWLNRILKPVEKLYEIDWNLNCDEFVGKLSLLNVLSIVKESQRLFADELQNRLKTNNLERGKLFFLSQMSAEQKRFAFLDILPMHLSGKMSSLLTSGHHFRVETGRWCNEPKETRLCQPCNTVDDEEHALFHCPAHDDLRCDLWEKLKTSPLSGNLNLKEIFILTLNSCESDINKNVLFNIANYVHKVLKRAYDVYSGSLVLIPDTFFDGMVLLNQ